MTIETALHRYARLFESVSPADLPELDRYFVPNARFKDPFNDVRGIDAIRQVFQRMFDTCLDIEFRVQHRFIEGHTGFLQWTMTFRPDVAGLRKQSWYIEGASRIIFDDNGRILEHVDYWDASEYFYSRLPLVGGLIRFIKRRVG